LNDNLAKCSAITNRGTRCRGIAVGTSGLCPAHDPAYKEQRLVGQKRGGKAKPLKEVQNVKIRLEKLAEDVLDEEVGKAEAATVNAILGTYLKALVVESQLREQATIEERIAELEEIIGATSGGAPAKQSRRLSR
jgi:hypothetical protein